jgi:hypothetical protein
MTISDIIILYIMSYSNDIQLNTQFKKYKQKYFTEINTNDTIQCMLLNKYVKYNGRGETHTLATSNSEEGNTIFPFAIILKYLEHEENKFIIQSNTNNYYYKTTETSNKKQNKINFYNKNLDNRYC